VEYIRLSYDRLGDELQDAFRESTSGHTPHLADEQ
jgi:hypothetical protein